MMEAQDFQDHDGSYTEKNAGSRANNQNVLRIIFIVFTVISCCCIVVGALIVWLDPFDWNLLARISGNYDAAAEAVPEDALVYIGIDLLKLTTLEMQQVLEAIAQTNPDFAFSSPEAALAELDNELGDEFSFNFAEDVLPWVGQYAGVGISEIELDDFGGIESFDMVFAAAVRDRGAAELFVEQFQAQLELDSGTPLRVESYDGTTIYQLDGVNNLAFALHKRLFLVGSSGDAIRASIDAKTNRSFMDTQEFKDLSASLPASRILSGFFTEAMFDEVLGGLTQMPGGVQPLNNALQYKSGAFGFSFVEKGLQLDLAMQFDPGTVNEFQQELIDAYAEDVRLEGRLPEDTLFFIRGGRPDLSWSLYKRQMESMNLGTDMKESMAAFADEFGFNPDTDLFPNLDGEYILAVVPGSEGFFAAQNIPLGMAMLFETSNPAGLEPVVNAVDAMVADEIGFPPQKIDVNGNEIREVSVPFFGDFFSYGLAENLLMIATSTGLVEDMLAPAASLSSAADYQSVWVEFEAGMKPVIYADLAAILGTLREMMSAEEVQELNDDLGDSIAWIDKIAMANRFSDEGIQFSTLIVFVAGIEQ